MGAESGSLPLKVESSDVWGICERKIRLNQLMLFLLGFVTGLIQIFNAASDEKQKY
jgi:hypothetical protein